MNRCFHTGLVAVGWLAAGTALAAPPTGLSTLVQFTGGDAWAMYGHIASIAGGVVGTADGSGTVVMLTPPTVKGGAWTDTILHRFGIGGDGNYPQGGVVASGGSLFGSTSGGGGTICGGTGCGTVFQLIPPSVPGGAWTESLLVSFTNDTNGYSPNDTVAASGTSTVFGTTDRASNDTVHPGGTSPVGGVVYELKKSKTGTWTETVLHHFDAASSDGDTPYGGLIIGPDKTLYGTTFTGGSCNQGTVYSLTPPATSGGAWTETRLHDFGNVGTGSCNYGDGEEPVAALTLVGSTLYGTTRAGGSTSCGTAFAITLGSSPSYQALYTFGQTSADSCSPQAPVLVDSSGALYGTTAFGGGAAASMECAYGCGTLFKLVPQVGGAYANTVLYAFTGGIDGSEPRSNLIGVPGKTLKSAASHGGFASDTNEPDYSSYGTFFQYKP